jgi:hypothetical protein
MPGTYRRPAAVSPSRRTVPVVVKRSAFQAVIAMLSRNARTFTTTR